MKNSQLSSILALTAAIVMIGIGPTARSQESAAADIGDRRELFVDDRLIDRLDGARLALHAPQPREVVLKFDKPWGGLYSGYETMLRVGNLFRIYYRGLPVR